MIRALPNLLLLFLLLFTLNLRAQVTVTNGTQLTILPGTTVSLEQDAVLLSGSALDQQGTLNFKGTFIHNGTGLFPPGSRLVANGTSRQQMIGTGVYSLPYLKVVNPSGVELLAPVSITDSLVLTNGVLYSTAAAPVRFTTTAAAPQETANSYISGHAIMEDRELGLKAMEPFLGFSLSAGEEAGHLRLTRVSGPGGIVSTVAPKTSIAARWQVQTTAQPTASNRTALFTWPRYLDNDINMRAIDLYAAGASGTYRKLNDDSVNISALDPRAFSFPLDTLDRTYTLSSSVPNLEFLKLYGELVTAGVDLKWVTGHEAKNKGFDVERSPDAVRFQTIAFVEGKNGTPTNNYNWVDREVHKQKWRAAYYRLKQYDIYGNYQYSNTVVVSLDNSTLYRFHPYPNPFNHWLKIDIHKEDSEPLTVQLVAANGAKVYEQTYSIGSKGTIHLKGLGGLASGVYFLRVVNNHVDDTIEVLKSNN